MGSGKRARYNSADNVNSPETIYGRYLSAILQNTLLLLLSLYKIIVHFMEITQNNKNTLERNIEIENIFYFLYW